MQKAASKIDDCLFISQGNAYYLLNSKDNSKFRLGTEVNDVYVDYEKQMEYWIRS